MTRERRILIAFFAIAVLTPSLASRAEEDPTPVPIPTPARGVNLARTARNITASGCDGEENEPWCVGDGSLLTEWRCSPGYGATLEMDLGTRCLVDVVVVVHPGVRGNGSAKNVLAYEIAIRTRSALDAPWETVFNVLNERDTAYNYLAFDAPREVRYLQLFVAAPSSENPPSARIVEWEVWGERMGGLERPESDRRQERENRDDEPLPERLLSAHRDLQRAGFYTEARAQYEAVLSQGDLSKEAKVRALFRLSQLLELEYEFPEEDPYIREILDLFSDEPWAVSLACLREGQRHLRQGRWEEAERFFQWAVAHSPHSEGAYTARVELIRVYTHLGRNVEAILAYQEVLEGYPEHVTRRQLGRAEVAFALFPESQPPEDCLGRLKEVLEEFLDEPEVESLVYARLAEVYYLKCHDYGRALEHLRMVRGRAPDEIGTERVLYYLAASLSRLERDLEAGKEATALQERFHGPKAKAADWILQKLEYKRMLRVLGGENR